MPTKKQTINSDSQLRETDSTLKASALTPKAAGAQAQPPVHYAHHIDLKELILVTLFILGLALAVYSTQMYTVEQSKLAASQANLVAVQTQLNALIANDPTAQANLQDQATIAAVGKLIVLPSGETPTVATVTDPTKLPDQPFFANAKSGDKVLIFTAAKEAILYRPGTNIIVDTTPISTGPGTTTAGTAGSGDPFSIGFVISINSDSDINFEIAVYKRYHRYGFEL